MSGNGKNKNGFAIVVFLLVIGIIFGLLAELIHGCERAQLNARHEAYKRKMEEERRLPIEEQQRLQRGTIS